MLLPQTGDREQSREVREGIHLHALLQVRSILDPKTAAARRVTKTAGVHTSHGGKTTSTGRVSGGTPMQAENTERRALMTATHKSATAAQNVGRLLLEETVFVTTKTHIQGKNRLHVTTVGKLLGEGGNWLLTD